MNATNARSRPLVTRTSAPLCWTLRKTTVVLDHGLPDVIGTVGLSGNNAVTAPAITPSAGALTMLFSVCDQSSNDPINDGGFVDIAVDAANNGGGNGSARELFAWTRAASGAGTGNVDVGWDSSRNAAVLLSFH